MGAVAELLDYFFPYWFDAGPVHAVLLFNRFTFSLSSVPYVAITNNSTIVTGTSQLIIGNRGIGFGRGG
jgi:hypothetical protein